LPFLLSARVEDQTDRYMFKARGIMFSARKTDTLAVFIFDFYTSCEHIT
jgi:hypothetical protein